MKSIRNAFNPCPVGFAGIGLQPLQDPVTEPIQRAHFDIGICDEPAIDFKKRPANHYPCGDGKIGQFRQRQNQAANRFYANRHVRPIAGCHPTGMQVQRRGQPGDFALLETLSM